MYKGGQDNEGACIPSQWYPEGEQLSAITGDESTKANIKCRFSIPQAKAAFLDSQRESEIGVAQSSADEASNVLDFEEFKECICRAGIDKYHAVKAFSAAVRRIFLGHQPVHLGRSPFAQILIVRSLVDTQIDMLLCAYAGDP